MTFAQIVFHFFVDFGIIQILTIIFCNRSIYYIHNGKKNMRGNAAQSSLIKECPFKDF